MGYSNDPPWFLPFWHRNAGDHEASSSAARPSATGHGLHEASEEHRRRSICRLEEFDVAKRVIFHGIYVGFNGDLMGFIRFYGDLNPPKKGFN